MTNLQRFKTWQANILATLTCWRMKSLCKLATILHPYQGLNISRARKLCKFAFKSYVNFPEQAGEKPNINLMELFLPLSSSSSCAAATRWMNCIIVAFPPRLYRTRCESLCGPSKVCVCRTVRPGRGRGGREQQSHFPEDRRAAFEIMRFGEEHSLVPCTRSRAGKSIIAWHTDECNSRLTQNFSLPCRPTRHLRPFIRSCRTRLDSDFGPATDEWNSRCHVWEESETRGCDHPTGRRRR